MSEKELATLLETAEKDENPKWIGFADWTDMPNPLSPPPSFTSSRSPMTSMIPTQPTRQNIVYPILENLNYLNLNTSIAQLESYFTRMYNTDSGVESAEWMHDEFVRLSLNSSLNITTSLYNHGGWPQQSVISIMQGDGTSDEIIIMGAHLDSTSSGGGGRAPGADDDGCGVATIFEMFRLVAQATNFRPKREIHWMLYAAEEVGLRGSTEIANEYNSRQIPIYAVYQSEMCGWRGEEPDVVVIDDLYTDDDLVDFSVELIDEYCEYPAVREACNSACSDHASWSRVGAATICTAEAGPNGELNPHYHRATDLLEHIDTEYAQDFVRYGVSFAVELSLAD